MHIFNLIAIFLPATLALQPLDYRQATTTPPPSPFSGNAAQLISLYIPSSIQSLLYVYFTSVESTTGDPASVIESAFTAIEPPSWLDAVPTEYQSNIEALESAIKGLRVAATGGVGASATGESSAQITSEGNKSGSGSTASTSGGEETETTGPVHTSTTPSVHSGPSASSSSSSGFGVPTAVPIAAAAGVLGFVGAVLAL